MSDQPLSTSSRQTLMHVQKVWITRSQTRRDSSTWRTIQIVQVVDGEWINTEIELRGDIDTTIVAGVDPE